MRNYTILFLLLVLPFIASAQTDTEEDKAYEAIEQLPEIMEMIKNDTGKVWQLKMRTTRTPGASFKYYWIAVEQTNGQRFYTQYNFYVDPKDLKPYMLDAKTDSLLTIEQWRARER